jgi:phosphoglycolate phosphatase-like HAD superfamily hydrolase
MIKSAAQNFNIDVSQSYMVGDTSTDALTAKNAGLKFIGVQTGYGCKDGKHEINIDLIVKNLNEATNLILGKSI